jgi:hypothetical protein
LIIFQFQCIPQQGRQENEDNIKTFVQGCGQGDWFVLYQMSKGLNRPFFTDFLITLTRLEAEKTDTS